VPPQAQLPCAGSAAARRAERRRLSEAASSRAASEAVSEAGSDLGDGDDGGDDEDGGERDARTPGGSEPVRSIEARPPALWPLGRSDDFSREERASPGLHRAFGRDRVGLGSQTPALFG